MTFDFLAVDLLIAVILFAGYLISGIFAAVNGGNRAFALSIALIFLFMIWVEIKL